MIYLYGVETDIDSRDIVCDLCYFRNDCKLNHDDGDNLNLDKFTVTNELLCESTNSIYYKEVPADKKEETFKIEINGEPVEGDTDKQKQLGDKPKYWNRINVSACIDPIARIRSSAIDKLGKYPENMTWPDIPVEDFIDAIQRHLNKIYEAGDPFAVDEETGCFHIDAIAWNHMVIEMKRTGRERDVNTDK